MLLSPASTFGNGFNGIIFFITLALGVVSSVLMILAYKPLREMKKQGWNYLFYSAIVSTASTMLSLLVMFGGIGSIIGILIGAYLLFEIRGRYN